MNSEDPTGEFGIDTLVGAVVGAGISIASYYMSNGSDSTFAGCLIAGVSGAVSGAFLSESLLLRAAGAAIQGIYSAWTTDGTLTQKLVCGGISAVSSFGLGSGAGKLGKMAFSSKLEQYIGNSIVDITAGALNDSITRIAQGSVRSCGNNASTQNRKAKASNSRTKQNRTREIM